MRTLTRGTYSVRYKGSLLYYAIAFRFNTKRFLVSGVNIALNVTSTVAKSLMRKNLIQRRTRSFDLSISLFVTFSSFLFVVVVVVPCFL